MGNHEVLFCKGDLGGTLDKLAAKARGTIMKLDATELDPQNEDALFEHLTHEFVVNPLQLHRDKMTQQGPREVEIEIRGHQAFPYVENHVRVRGIEVTFIIPFNGDPWLFKCRPNSWTTVYPEGQIAGQEYRLALRDPEKNADRVAKNRNWQLQHVDDYIRRQADQIQSFNDAIVRLFHETVAQRRQELQANQAFAEAFDVPQRIDQETSPPAAQAFRRRNSTLPVKKPSVFLCYANKDAEAANGLFDELASVGADPWLDKRKLVHGDDWEHEIKNAVAKADAFVACLTSGFDQIGFRQKEVRWALDALELRPLGRGFVIPFIIEPCDLPEWSKRFHAGDLSKPTTFDELIRAVEKHCDWINMPKGT